MPTTIGVGGGGTTTPTEIINISHVSSGEIETNVTSVYDENITLFSIKYSNMLNISINNDII